LIMNISFRDIGYITVTFLVLLGFAIYHPDGSFAMNPTYWADEAVSVEKARSLLTYGTLDIAVAPGVLSDKPYATAAAGPLLTVPLAGFFSVFGISVTGVRVFMMIVLGILTVSVYFFARSLYGQGVGFAATLLFVTFSPLYANGKTATGDIPGFLALLFGLWVLFKKRWYVFSGILLGVAITTKPSLYLPVAGIAVLEIFLSEHTKERIIHALRLMGGSLIVCLPWLYSLIPDMKNPASWKETYFFFRNPFPDDAVSVIYQLMQGNISALVHTTIFHFFILFIVAGTVYIFTRHLDEARYRFIRFAVLYSAVAFILYLRSPSWLRYLIAGELLLFISFLPSLETIWHARAFRYWVPKWFPAFIVGFLIMLQGIHMGFFAWRTASWTVPEKAQAITALLNPGDTIGVIDDISVASLINSRQKFQIVRISGNTILGKNPLAYSSNELPTYIYIPRSRFGNMAVRDFVDPYKDILETYYKSIPVPEERYMLYKRL